eukprot:Nk52_evm7s1810 gene=Nk52_evmTU7s1810
MATLKKCMAGIDAVFIALIVATVLAGNSLALPLLSYNENMCLKACQKVTHQEGTFQFNTCLGNCARQIGDKKLLHSDISKKDTAECGVVCSSGSRSTPGIVQYECQYECKEGGTNTILATVMNKLNRPSIQGQKNNVVKRENLGESFISRLKGNTQAIVIDVKVNEITENTREVRVEDLKSMNSNQLKAAISLHQKPDVDVIEFHNKIMIRYTYLKRQDDSWTNTFKNLFENSSKLLRDSSIIIAIIDIQLLLLLLSLHYFCYEEEVIEERIYGPLKKSFKACITHPGDFDKHEKTYASSSVDFGIQVNTGNVLAQEAATQCTVPHSESASVSTNTESKSVSASSQTSKSILRMINESTQAEPHNLDSCTQTSTTRASYSCQVGTPSVHTTSEGSQTELKHHRI